MIVSPSASVAVGVTFTLLPSTTVAIIPAAVVQVGDTSTLISGADNQNKPEFNKEIIGSVTLPIPNGVSDQNAVNFGAGTLNPAQKELSNIAFKTILEGVSEGGRQARKAFDKAVKDKNIQRAVAGYISGTAVGIDPNEILSRLDGTSFNNNLA